MPQVDIYSYLLTCLRITCLSPTQRKRENSESFLDYYTPLQIVTRPQTVGVANNLWLAQKHRPAGVPPTRPGAGPQFGDLQAGLQT